MASEAFAVGLFELMLIGRGVRTVVMCAELLWWRCHRRLLADVLLVSGFDVRHITDEGVATAHQLAPPARIVSGKLCYPGEDKAWHPAC